MNKRHDEENGCKVIFLGKEETKGKNASILLKFYCRTHSKDVCRCGYAWGEHPEKILRTNYPYRLIYNLFKNENKKKKNKKKQQ